MPQTPPNIEQQKRHPRPTQNDAYRQTGLTRDKRIRHEEHRPSRPQSVQRPFGIRPYGALNQPRPIRGEHDDGLTRQKGDEVDQGHDGREGRPRRQRRHGPSVQYVDVDDGHVEMEVIRERHGGEGQLEEHQGIYGTLQSQ
mmetsp:Transcript_26454/g.54790  ORF Transcript_26454/g.54790 Transcript_26454/m.54790 type:complete len:141 (+) Transcript_26454:718-1140(+)